MAIELKTPLGSAAARALRAGDMCLLTGELYTARDAAHKRLCALLEAGQPLPFDMRGAVIYFVGPTPAKPGQAIGSAGPTTSYRMDTYSPALPVSYTHLDVYKRQDGSPSRSGCPDGRCAA